MTLLQGGVLIFFFRNVHYVIWSDEINYRGKLQILKNILQPFIINSITEKDNINKGANILSKHWFKYFPDNISPNNAILLMFSLKKKTPRQSSITSLVTWLLKLNQSKHISVLRALKYLSRLFLGVRLKYNDYFVCCWTRCCCVVQKRRATKKLRWWTVMNLIKIRKIANNTRTHAVLLQWTFIIMRISEAVTPVIMPFKKY